MEQELAGERTEEVLVGLWAGGEILGAERAASQRLKRAPRVVGNARPWREEKCVFV